MDRTFAKYQIVEKMKASEDRNQQLRKLKAEIERYKLRIKIL